MVNGDERSPLRRSAAGTAPVLDRIDEGEVAEETVREALPIWKILPMRHVHSEV